MNYQEAVTEARQLAKRSEEDQWRLAQLTWENASPIEGDGKHSQRQWARDTGMAYSHVQYLYRVWAEWGSCALSERPVFGEAYVAARHGVGSEEASTARGSERALSEVRRMPPEHKAEIVRELIDDPDVSARVMRDPHTRANVVRAQRAAWDEQEQTAREQVKADPHLNAAQEAVLALSIENDLGMARWRIAEATRKRMELADSRTGQYADAVRQIEDALSWFRTADDGGRVTDEALADLLAEGGGE